MRTRLERVMATYLACATLLPLATGAISFGPEESSPQQAHVASFLENLVQRFSASGFIFHLEDSAEEETPWFGAFYASLRVMDAARLIVSHPDGVAKVTRPIGYQFIHVVLLSRPSRVTSFLEGKGNVRPSDRALFVVSQKTLEEENGLGARAFWRKGSRGRPNRVHRLGSTVFAVPSEGGVAIYDVCHFCGPSSGHLRPTAFWDASTPRSAFASLDVFPDNWSDLKGHVVKVLYVPFPPIIWCEELETEGQGGCHRGERVCTRGALGPEGRLINMASRRLNFTARLVEFGSSCGGREGAEGRAASPSNDASLWDDMIAVLSSPTSDEDLLGIGDISITAARTQQVYFTTVFNREPHTFAYLHRRPDGATFGVAGPFSAKVWLCLAVAWAVTGLILATIHTTCRLLPESLWAAGVIMLGQGMSPKVFTARRPVRPLFLCWCWLCFVLASVYQSKLVSSLVNPVTPHDPSTLEDLLIDRYEMVSPRSSLFAVRGLLNSTDPEYRRVGKMMRIMETVDDCVRLLVEASHRTRASRVALIAENTFLRWELPKMLPEGMSDRLRIGSAEILAYGQAWALRRDAMALEPALSHALATATASGLPRYWLGRSLKRGREAPVGPRREEPAEKVALPLRLFAASLYVWASGLTAASTALIAELALSAVLRRHQRKTGRHKRWRS